MRGSFREVMEELAREVAPGEELFARLMSNAADTQEELAREVLERFHVEQGE